MPGPASYFNYADVETLDPATAALVTRRRHAMGAAYRLFYSHPLEFVSGSGTKLLDAQGQTYLDAYNNVPVAGHCHPRIVEAVARQAALLNTHTRYLDEAVVAYSENLLDTLPADLDNVMYTCTGSEANDLALRIAQWATGGTGIIVTAEAYHGITTATAAISPSLGGIGSIGPAVRTVPAPRSDDGAFLAGISAALDDFASSGIRPAALVFDTIFASDGVFTPPADVLAQAAQLVRSAGALVIADEVQAGFGRLGQMWGFEGLVPDIVTLGKPMGSGQPIAAIIAAHALIDEFGANVRYFSTFAANGVSIAAAQATLEVLRDELLVENAHAVGAYLRSSLAEMQRSHDTVRAIRGAGLFVGIELGIPDALTESTGDQAFAVVNAMRDRHVLTAAIGPHRNVLKVRPPLSFDRADADQFIDALDSALRATWHQ